MSPPILPGAGMSFTDPMHNDTYPAIDSATKSDHSGKIVFITGASYGIGKATAISYAKAGAEGIILAARSDLSAVETAVQEAAKTAGKKAPRVLVLKMDVANEASVADGAAAVEKEFGRLDILINNAGYLSEFVPIGDSVPENWWRNFEVNIKGVYLVSRALLPLLLKGGDKTIVNLGSIGSHMTFGGGSGYQTTKFALLRMTEILQSDYDEQGILAYCVHPGGIMTELGHGLPDGLHPFLVDTVEMAGDTIANLTSVKRIWLAGRYISCNWDMPQFYAMEDEIVKGNDVLKMRMNW